MKTLSGTFAFMLVLIAIVTVLSCCEQQLRAPEEASLEIGKDKVKYVKVNETKLKKAVDALKANGGKCQLVFMKNNGTLDNKPYYHCTDTIPPPCGDMNLKTDQVTTSANAKNGLVGESVANDPNITYRVQGPSKYVKKVVNSFED
jgi:hypothetical protein